MHSILSFLETRMSDLNLNIPTNYSLFHILSILIVSLTTALLILFSKRISDKSYRKIILFAWISLVLFEIYKQIIFTFEAKADGTIGTSYQWYAFPFQFCSTPLYILPFVALLKEGKVRDCFISFLCTFCLFGGLAVYVFPNDVFMDYLGINIQTMVHHGTQVILGIFTAYYYRNKLKDIRFYFKGTIVFVGFCLVAILLNETIGLHVMSLGGTFNMFFISRHYPSTLPVLSLIYPNVHPILFILIYIIGFTIIGFIVYWIEYPLTLFKRKNS